jgi:hypothetical protein
MLCPATKDDFGYTSVDPQTLASEMARCMNDQALLDRFGTTARERCRRLFAWDVVIEYYEAILSGKNPNVRLTDLDATSLEASGAQ